MNGVQKMKRFWINPNYKIREEYFGGLAYFLEDISWEIGKKAIEILKICNGKTEKELTSELNLKSGDIKLFLNDALKKNILINEKPHNLRKVTVRDYKEEYCLTAPTGVFFEITYKCNMNCKHCYTSSEENICKNIDQRELTTKEIFNLIDESAKMGVFVFSLGGGEPFMRKDILEILEYGIKKNIEMIPVTNGLLLNEENIQKMKSFGLRQIVVSLDGSTDKIYSTIRGGNNFYKVIKNIKKLTKNNFRVLINCVVTKKNLDDLEEIIILVKKLSVNAIRFIRLAEFGRAKENEDLWLEKKDYFHFVKNLEILSQEYSKEGFVVLKDEAFLGLFDNQRIKKRMSWLPKRYCGCPAGRSFIFINPFGDVYPCGYLEFNEFLIANVRNNSLEEIWQNKMNNKFFDYLRKMTKLCDICENCKNKFMCQGGCRATAFLKYKKLNAPDSLCFKELLEKNNFVIRKIMPDDILEISNLIIRNLKEINSKDYDSETIKSLIEDYNLEGIKKRIKEGKMIVIKKNNLIVGTGRFFNGKIFDVFVLPEFHRKGVGKMIMKELESNAKKVGSKKISLPASLTAINFYEKLGYSLDKNLNEKSKSSYWMSKTLT